MALLTRRTLAADPDLEVVRIVVAAIALVAMVRRTATPVALSRSAMTGRVWPSYGLPCGALGVNHELLASRDGDGVAIKTSQPNSYRERALPRRDPCRKHTPSRSHRLSRACLC